MRYKIVKDYISKKIKQTIDGKKKKKIHFFGSFNKNKNESNKVKSGDQVLQLAPNPRSKSQKHMTRVMSYWTSFCTWEKGNDMEKYRVLDRMCAKPKPITLPNSRKRDDITNFRQ